MEKVWMCLPNFAKRASCMLCTSSEDEKFSIGISKIEYEIEGDVACIVLLLVVLKLLGWVGVMVDRGYFGQSGVILDKYGKTINNDA